MTVNILIDFETAAMTERAAILSIGAVPFVLPSDDVAYRFETKGQLTDMFSEVVAEQKPFFATINATSCIMSGMEFDQNTVDWWSRQSADAKAQFEHPEAMMNIEQAFIALIDYIRNLRQHFDSDIQIWTQGTDFDIPKLRYCCTRIAEIPESQLPWRYNAVRDARTYVLENLALLFSRKPAKEAYNDIPKNTDLERSVTHDVLSDCRKSIWSVQQVNLMLMTAMREKRE